MTIRRREVLTGTAATGLLGPLASRSFAQASKSGTVRVWGEPGPYGGVAVAAMNEWAQKNAPGLKFEIETIPWDGVYVKLMTDLAARRPPALISVESPLAMQLMAEELLVPLDDVADKVGRDRLVPGVKWDFWGAWKGKQYVIPAHHQPHLLRAHLEDGGLLVVGGDGQLEFLRAGRLCLLDLHGHPADRLRGVEGQGHRLLARLPRDPAARPRASPAVEGVVHGMLGVLGRHEHGRQGGTQR